MRLGHCKVFKPSSIPLEWGRYLDFLREEFVAQRLKSFSNQVFKYFRK
jgi:hypothetical protein